MQRGQLAPAFLIVSITQRVECPNSFGLRKGDRNETARRRMDRGRCSDTTILHSSDVDRVAEILQSGEAAVSDRLKRDDLVHSV